jgi:hypothetical protein
MGNESSTMGAEATATMYLCGASKKSCINATVPERVVQVIKQGNLYNEPEFRPAIMRVMQTVHEGRACVFPWRFFYLFLEGREGKAEMGKTERGDIVHEPWDKQRFAQFLQNCDKPAVGVFISFKGHANMVVINNIQRTIEHFEPHGGAASHLSSEQNAELRNAIQSNLGVGKASGYTYIPPEAVCPIIRIGTYINEFGQSVEAESLGPQGLQNKMTKSTFDGSCSLWSLWFMHVRLSSPQLSLQESMKRAMSLAFDANVANSPMRHKQGMSEEDKKWCTEEAHRNPWFCTDDPPPPHMKWTERDRKMWGEKCGGPSYCTSVKELYKGGSKLLEFIKDFTMQLVSMLDIESYRATCIKIKDGEEFVEKCFALPPDPTSATVVVYLVQSGEVKDIQAAFKERVEVGYTLFKDEVITVDPKHPGMVGNDFSEGQMYIRGVPVISQQDTMFPRGFVRLVKNYLDAHYPLRRRSDGGDAPPKPVAPAPAPAPPKAAPAKRRAREEPSTNQLSANAAKAFIDIMPEDDTVMVYIPASSTEEQEDRYDDMADEVMTPKAYADALVIKFPTNVPGVRGFQRHYGAPPDKDAVTVIAYGKYSAEYSKKIAAAYRNNFGANGVARRRKTGGRR